MKYRIVKTDTLRGGNVASTKYHVEKGVVVGVFIERVDWYVTSLEEEQTALYMARLSYSDLPKDRDSLEYCEALIRVLKGEHKTTQRETVIGEY